MNRSFGWDASGSLSAWASSLRARPGQPDPRPLQPGRLVVHGFWRRGGSRRHGRESAGLLVHDHQDYGKRIECERAVEQRNSGIRSLAFMAPQSAALCCPMAYVPEFLLATGVVVLLTSLAGFFAAAPAL